MQSSVFGFFIQYYVFDVHLFVAFNSSLFIFTEIWNILLYELYHNLFSHSTIDGHLYCFQSELLPIIIINMNILTFLENMCHISVGYIPRSRIAGSHSNFVFICLSNCQTIFQSSRPFLHSYQQCLGALNDRSGFYVLSRLRFDTSHLFSLRGNRVTMHGPSLSSSSSNLPIETWHSSPSKQNRSAMTELHCWPGGSLFGHMTGWTRWSLHFT